MGIRIISFTAEGAAAGKRLLSVLKGRDAKFYPCGGSAENGGTYSAKDTVREAFRMKDGLIFIGAAGIAVRLIAPYLEDKRTDPPVLVMDEKARFVIPILSGHLGGANALAEETAEALGAVPVITTATDIREAFAADLFAAERNLGIVNRDGIAKVSSAALDGRPVTLSIRNWPPKEPVDVLITDEPGTVTDTPVYKRASLLLTARPYVLGTGCRKGIPADVILSQAEEALGEAGIEASEIAAVASIDLKAEEPGIAALSRAWHVPLLTFDAELLRQVSGASVSSEFVEKTVGVDNVCERAALLAAGRGAELVLPRRAGEGVTMALARRRRHE